MEARTKHQIPNTKLQRNPGIETPRTRLQTPKKSQVPSSKPRPALRAWNFELVASLLFEAWVFDVWSLGLGDSLVFGVWSFNWHRRRRCRSMGRRSLRAVDVRTTTERQHGHAVQIPGADSANPHAGAVRLRRGARGGIAPGRRTGRAADRNGLWSGGQCA